MKYVEYGAQHSQVILLLHGGGLSWWNFREEAELLGQQYHVVLPILDGHTGSDAPFTSMEDNAREIIAWVDGHCGGQVLLMGGLSLGGQVLVEILSQRPEICQHAILESTLVFPMRLTHALVKPSYTLCYPLIRQRWFARLQFRSLHIQPELFEEYYRDTAGLTRPDMIAFLEANSSYGIRSQLSKTSAKVLITAGSREQKCILESAEILGKAIPESRVEILPGLRHGELSLNYPDRYVRLLRCWMEKGATQNETL